MIISVLVPTPNLELMVISPPNFKTSVRIADIPTPRPDVWVTVSEVEKPSQNKISKALLELIFSLSKRSLKPLALALSINFLPSIPPPMSSNVQVEYVPIDAMKGNSPPVAASSYGGSDIPSFSASAPGPDYKRQTLGITA